MSEVTAGDAGEVRRFGLGSVVLMDDLTGKGHITRVRTVSSTDVTLELLLLKLLMDSVGTFRTL